MLLCTIIERRRDSAGKTLSPVARECPARGPDPCQPRTETGLFRPQPWAPPGEGRSRQERRGEAPCRRGGRAPVRRVVHYCLGFTRENVNTRVLCSRSDGHTMTLTPSVRLSRSPPHGVTSQVHVFQTTPPRARGSAWPSPTATCSPRAVNLSPPTWRPAGPPRARRRLSPHAPR